jgi:hypothetical protein
MAVPETAMYKNNSLIPTENYIRSARHDATGILSKAVPKAVENGPHNALWQCIA